MTLFDLFLLVLVAGGAYLGYRKGLIANIGSLVGVVAGIILCQAFASTLAAKFNSPGDSAQTRLLHTVMSYALVFIASYVGSRMLANFFRAAVRTLHLRPLDRIAGAVFNVLEWTLFYSIALNLWLLIMPDSDIRSSKSYLTSAVLNLAPNVLGSDTARDIMAATDRASQNLKDNGSDSTSVSRDVEEIVVERVTAPLKKQPEKNTRHNSATKNNAKPVHHKK